MVGYISNNTRTSISYHSKKKTKKKRPRPTDLYFNLEINWAPDFDGYISEMSDDNCRFRSRQLN